MEGFYRTDVSREEFREALGIYSGYVSLKKVKKLEYDKWRPLYLWCREDDNKWQDYTIRLVYDEDRPNLIFIYPWHDLYISPNPVEIETESDFGQFLFATWKGLKSMTNCYNASYSNSNADKITKIDYNYSDSAVAVGNYSNQLINSYEDLPWTIEFDSPASCVDDKSLTETVKEIIDKYENEKEKNNNMNFNFDFGPVDSSVRMSMYGMAIKNASGTYVAYDAKSGQIMDVDILNFEGANKFLYKMPVALREVRSGDIVVHARKPMFVQATLCDNRLKVLDIYDGEEKTIVPAKSPFGFEFITKVVSFVDFTGTASNSNPFGNMLPFILMGDNKNFDEILPFFFMSGQGAANGFTANPMLMYALMSKDAKMKDMLPFILMMNPAVPGHSCCCGCHEDDSCDKAN